MVSFAFHCPNDELARSDATPHQNPDAGGVVCAHLCAHQRASDSWQLLTGHFHEDVGKS